MGTSPAIWTFGSRLSSWIESREDMPRQVRLDAPGTLHHVIVRGIEWGKIVQDRWDREGFMRRLGETATDTVVYAWALHCRGSSGGESPSRPRSPCTEHRQRHRNSQSRCHRGHRQVIQEIVRCTMPRQARLDAPGVIPYVMAREIDHRIHKSLFLL
jgi:hypothetical protein